MARIAVLASGSGSNFEAITLALRETGGRHETAILICDRAKAFALERARRLGIPSRVISYRDKTQDEAESEMAAAIDRAGCALVVLAGFMRILSPGFVGRYRGRIVNVHPSLLPAYPGIHSVERAFAAAEPYLGVTVHYVDEGMDTGSVIEQIKVPARATLEETEAAIHAAEHEIYPKTILKLLEQKSRTKN